MSELPGDAEAVVIGAGAFGFSVAFQLANLGAGRVVLLDQRHAVPRIVARFGFEPHVFQQHRQRFRLVRVIIDNQDTKYLISPHYEIPAPSL